MLPNRSALSYILRHSKRICTSRASSAVIRYSSTEPLPLPQADEEKRIYSDKIQNIVSEISKLTLLEVADLNELLKKTLNIPDAPVISMGMVGAAPAQKSEEEEEEEGATSKVQTSFVVKIAKFDDSKKVPLIKHIKTIMDGMNLVQAKKFVETLPAVVRSDATKEESEKLKEELDALGAEVIIE